jgi:hypothetical protein
MENSLSAVSYRPSGESRFSLFAIRCSPFALRCEQEKSIVILSDERSEELKEPYFRRVQPSNKNASSLSLLQDLWDDVNDMSGCGATCART